MMRPVTFQEDDTELAWQIPFCSSLSSSWDSRVNVSSPAVAHAASGTWVAPAKQGMGAIIPSSILWIFMPRGSFTISIS